MKLPFETIQANAITKTTPVLLTLTISHNYVRSLKLHPVLEEYKNCGADTEGV
jgi:hypothetical protein